MWLSPLQAVLKARRLHSLGTLNPVPYGITVVNCISWVSYSIIIKDYYVYFANCFGVILGLFSTSTALSILYSPNINEKGKKVHFQLECLLIAGAFYFITIFLIIGLVFNSKNVDSKIAGYITGWFSVLCALSYYGSPLSTLKEVITTRDSATLHVPMICANAVNATAFVSLLIHYNSNPNTK